MGAGAGAGIRPAAACALKELKTRLLCAVMWFCISIESEGSSYGRPKTSMNVAPQSNLNAMFLSSLTGRQNST